MNRGALYYQHPYQKEFRARVLSCREAGKGRGGRYEVVLDQEGFYPEGGGQPGDRGRIGDALVLDAREGKSPVQSMKGQAFHTSFVPLARHKWDSMPAASSQSMDARDGMSSLQDMGAREGDSPVDVREVLLYTDRSLVPGQEYDCGIDWEFRFRNMQSHSGEHIVSGLVHSRYGYDNVGFHMGGEGHGGVLTIDFNGEISWKELMELELEANRVVWQDLPVEILFPSEEELRAMEVRSKKELASLGGDVRLVRIPETDLCACCGTHVARTGEIGLIKFLSLAPHRGGVRIEMLCGTWALMDYEARREALSAGARLLSSPPEELPSALSKYMEESADKDRRIAALNEKYFRMKASQYSASGIPGGIIVEFEEGLNGVELRKYCDCLMKNTEAEIVAVFTAEKLPPSYCLNADSNGNDDSEGSKGENNNNNNNDNNNIINNIKDINDNNIIDSRNDDSKNAASENDMREFEFRYAIGSQREDVRVLGKELNKRFNGRGGGRPEMIQGTIKGSPLRMRAFMEEWSA